MVKIQPFPGRFSARILAAIRGHRSSTDREPEAQAGSIASSSVSEGSEHVVGSWQTATLVFDLDEDVSRLTPCPDHHSTRGLGVFEGVVKQVHQRGREELRIHVDDQRRIDYVDHQLYLA